MGGLVEFRFRTAAEDPRSNRRDHAVHGTLWRLPRSYCWAHYLTNEVRVYRIASLPFTITQY